MSKTATHAAAVKRSRAANRQERQRQEAAQAAEQERGNPVTPSEPDPRPRVDVMLFAHSGDVYVNGTHVDTINGAYESQHLNGLLHQIANATKVIAVRTIDHSALNRG